MTDSVLLIQQEGGVTELTLNRPDKRNALSAELVDALLQAVESRPPGTRLVVFRGVGKSFCAGFDFTTINEETDGDLALRFIRVEQLLQAIHHAPFTTMALAHGACFGAGADIFAVCKKRIAAPGTRFRMPGLRFGVVLGTRRLSELLGGDVARSILESSRIFDAEAGLEMGLVQELLAEPAWTAVVLGADEDAAVLGEDSMRALNAETTPNRRGEDLAALVRSVAVPGLRQRIEDFLSQSKPTPPTSTHPEQDITTFYGHI